ncbi:recombinase family protein [Duganella callida]|uniref:Recombinase family protein n=1 Tax=Duganella callida TaxID=2561932 RepID=A0A4Y9S7N0_9BURK|nr:recombinase family protein [Duganella callida]TFW17549.1 recombinase family protein [Duganella callida]
MAAGSSTRGKKAAIYVRMSTRPQDHSIEHQCDRLYAYASERGIEIVKMYADAGKSGLRINNRDGLRELIADVQARTADFSAVLVYDVSRWGRFQDVDEGAHYEFVCREAGIQVLYCAEPFENDGSALASIVKSMKRTMAAEYSRELSAKVFEAQRRFAVQGYKMGGSAGFGLRRMSFDRDGKQKRTLSHGERKGAITDRVRFCWGPADEVAVVRQIYSWFVDNHFTDTGIVTLLNQRKVESGTGRPWTPWLVKSILTNEKYAGRVVFNRGSAKLTGLRRLNPVDEWVCKVDLLPPIVSPALFDMAQEERKKRFAPMDRERVLAGLRSIHSKHGKVTVALINATPGLPNPKRIGEAFGTLAEAYALAGVGDSEKLQYARTKRSLQQMRKATLAACGLLIEQTGISYRYSKDRWCLCIDDKIIVKIVVARSRHDSAGRIRWRVPIYNAPVPDFVVCVLMDAANAVVLDYYLIPVQDFTAGHITLRAEYLQDQAAYRYTSLAAIFGRES